MTAVGVEVEVGDGATDKGMRAEGTGGPKGEQPSPIMATIPRVQAATQNLLGTEDRIDDPFLIDKRFIGNNKTYQVIILSRDPRQELGHRSTEIKSRTPYILSLIGQKVKGV